MKIAIIILNWNGQKLLEQFLPSIVRYSNPEYCDIYVADNASTDTSVEYVKSNFTSVKIIQNSKNGGYAKGYNDALINIDADIYALVNSDIEVTKDWLQPIISAFKNNKATAIVQPKILDYKNKVFFEYAGAGGGYIDKYGFPFCRGRIFNSLEKDTQQYNDTKEIFWASGACLFIRKEVFETLGGFDETYFAHQEEIDLCWRAKNMGFTIKYVGASTVYHIGGATLQESNPKKTYLNFRNSLFTLTKNLPSRQLFPILFIRLILDGIAGIRFLLQMKPFFTWMIIKSHGSFYANLNRNLKKRTKNNMKNYYYTKSIVWQHFIKGKKRFNEL
ncbi:MAG: dTDP-Rha--alpha-D-GlcNAc-pyrophosphate polyprenol alpha-3-L-rhamnosyltransferase [Lutibacter sp.]|nr:MAG: dTDP-Rha--alpha-D-GlcNAc-pyrophosphate polyprenol alpha-3-L-rhamnosyltransferase [Lutibacter sp.]